MKRSRTGIALFLAAALSLVLLTACSGGGGGGAIVNNAYHSVRLVQMVKGMGK